MSTNLKRELAVHLCGEAFIDALQRFGPSAVLDFLIRIPVGNDRDRWLMDEFLVMWASTVPIASFLKRIKTYEVTPEEFEHWMKSGCFV